MKLQAVSVTRKLVAVGVVVALAVLVALAAGCGSQRAASPDKQFVAQADAVCQHVAARRAAANEAIPPSSAGSKAQMTALAREAPRVAIAEHLAVARLLKLTVPASLTHDWQTLLAGMTQLANGATELARDARAGNFKAIQAIDASGRKLRKQLTEIATRDGFAYCGITS